MKPNTKAIQEALQDALGLPELPRRIECFDISHIQGAETVASMVVWEDGQMKKSDYRKFIIRGVIAWTISLRCARWSRVVTNVSRKSRRRRRKRKCPAWVLIDGGLGQLHAAAEALESVEIINQPLAAIAKREEIIYVYGQENEPVALDHHSPVLHLVQLIRDEAHVSRSPSTASGVQMRDRSTELQEIPGVAKAQPGDYWSISAPTGGEAGGFGSAFGQWSRVARRRRSWCTSGNSRKSSVYCHYKTKSAALRAGWRAVGVVQSIKHHRHRT